MYFKYGKEEINYLKGRCNKLADVIDKIGMIERKIDKVLFSVVVSNIYDT